MSELVYPPVIAAARGMFAALDLKIRIEGAEHIPTTGGAVLCSNHISYLDFIFCGFAARPSGRLVRFMAKREVFDNKISGPLMRGMRHISVDRQAGAASLATALRALRSGEVVGMFPEGTISRSFTVKDLKTGAGRMAGGTATPLIPMAVWGTHRLWTKGRPRTLLRRHLPVTVLVGEPMEVGRRDDQDLVMAELRARMIGLLDRAQREYPDSPAGPDDTWWLPAHLGGSAPTPEQANQMDAGVDDD